MHVVRILLNSLLALATLGALFSLSALFSKHYLLFDLVSHFRVQYIVLLLPAFFIAVVLKKTLPVLVISIALAIHGYTVTMSLLPISIQNDGDYVPLTVLNSNLLYANTNYQAQLNIIAEHNPDLIAFQEYTPKWHANISDQLVNYPYSVIEPADGSFGIALYSKHPINNGSIDPQSRPYPTIRADIQIDNFNVHVMAVHPPPPINSDRYLNRNRNMQTIALDANLQKSATLVIGDFNATPWTAHFSDMLSTGRLRNASTGHSLHATWPTSNYALRIPIDHILVNQKIAVEQFDSIYLDGSDHKNILSRLRVY